MGNDLKNGIDGFLSGAWKFFKIDIPGTSISFGVLFIGLLLIAVSFRFLSIMVGHNIGEATEAYGSMQRSIGRYRIAHERKNDLR